ncbi:MAG: DUF4258 domain-containing protein [Candidatus Schekmanbacteria bacterium]|nr:DUF4258 domain-containing protein [Candidatus Schekmanbacteria bacterium]
MAHRQLSTSEVRLVLEHGQAIATYPHDTPYPRRLVLAFAGGRPIHVVAADRPGTDETIVISVYEPDPDQWNETFSVRKQP